MSSLLTKNDEACHRSCASHVFASVLRKESGLLKSQNTINCHSLDLIRDEGRSMVQQRNTVSLIPVESLTDRLAAERERLRREAGLSGVKHFQRPQEHPFLAHERGKVTILFGGLTWKHEELIKAVFRGSGYRCEMLP